MQVHRTFTEGEVKEIIFQMDPWEAPGAVHVPAFFFFFFFKILEYNRYFCY